ncbi:Uncharacterized protein Fot_19442 [Forsythia ovata]|uniref:Uncharacterized protein n=1 Tax=Forsythia ovata TaxID=205694 RepID=A0ABD1VL17_9LAMI
MTQAHDPVDANPVSVGISSGPGSLVNLNDTVLPETESLSSWFNGQMGMGCGILPLNGNEPGPVPGLSYGLGVLDWPMESVDGGGGGNGGAAVSGGSPGCDTWQMNEGIEGGGMAEVGFGPFLDGHFAILNRKLDLSFNNLPSTVLESLGTCYALDSLISSTIISLKTAKNWSNFIPEFGHLGVLVKTHGYDHVVESTPWEIPQK